MYHLFFFTRSTNEEKGLTLKQSSQFHSFKNKDIYKAVHLLLNILNLMELYYLVLLLVVSLLVLKK